MATAAWFANVNNNGNANNNNASNPWVGGRPILETGKMVEYRSRYYGEKEELSLLEKLNNKRDAVGYDRNGYKREIYF
jgi:hypothetical protein